MLTSLLVSKVMGCVSSVLTGWVGVCVNYLHMCAVPMGVAFEDSHIHATYTSTPVCVCSFSSAVYVPVPSERTGLGGRRAAPSGLKLRPFWPTTLREAPITVHASRESHSDNILTVLDEVTL